MAANPLEPVVAPNAQPAPGQPAAPAPKNALFEKAGGDWNKAGESYFHAVSKIGELHGAVQARESRIQQLEAMLSPIVNGGAAPANDPWAKVTELGVPAEPFREAVTGEIEPAVEKALQKLLGPIVREMEASEQLSGQVENFDVLRGEARKFMAANPEVLDTFNAVRKENPAAAWRYAIREAMVAKGAQAPAPSPHTGLPGGVTPQGRAPVNPAGPTEQAREKDALEYGRAYGDMRPYSHERLKGTSVERAIRAMYQQLGVPEGSQGW